MKRSIGILLTAVLGLVMVVTSSMSVFADIDDSKAYSYTVRVYAGQQGHFEGGGDGVVSDGGKVWSREVKVLPGEKTRVDISNKSTGFTLDNNEYYAKGLRKTGHDNDELESASILVDGDKSYEIAYGIAGGMVKYTVKYVDKDGNDLAEADEYYGMRYDKPVVSYKYIDGYQPNAYNLKGTISDDESKNVFRFTYTKISGNADADADGDADGTGTGNGNGTNGNNGNANGANGNGTNGAANADGTDLTAGGNTEPAEIIDLDDTEGPLADSATGDDTDAAETEEPGGSGLPTGALVGGGACIAVAAAVVAILAAKRRKDQEE